MPLVTILLGIQTATPLVGLMAAAMSGMILLQSWRDVALRDDWRLVLASFAGMLVGIWLIRVAPEEFVSGGLGLLLIAFGLYTLLRPVLSELPNAHWVYFFGALAGALGAAYNTNGPPVVVYGALRRWSPVRFWATLQGFFLPSIDCRCRGRRLAQPAHPWRVFQSPALCDCDRAWVALADTICMRRTRMPLKKVIYADFIDANHPLHRHLRSIL